MVGTQELILILAILLIIFGPKKLPELARELGTAIQEFRKVSANLADTASLALREVDDATNIETIENSIDSDVRKMPTPPRFNGKQKKTVKNEEGTDIQNDR